MSKEIDTSDRTIAILVALLFLLIAAFAVAWWFLKPPPNPASNVSFAKIGPLGLQAETFTMRASLAVQTDLSNAKEAEKNRSQIEKFLQIRLQNIDPNLLISKDANKFTLLQAQLTKDVKDKYPKINVQQVWITDFVTSMD